MSVANNPPAHTRLWHSPNKFLTRPIACAEVLLRCVYLLIDPASPLKSPGIAEVVSSESSKYVAGDWVVANLPWSDYAAVSADQLRPLSDGFAGCAARDIIDDELNFDLRKLYAPVQMGLQKAGKITDREFLLQVSLARATKSKINGQIEEKHDVVQTSSSI